ncbi:MAG: hypothetical protein RMK93_03765, partial [Bacteroidota bacterium]|nr:hypothetical protein [Bacteroidota bacterium]
MGSIVLAAPLAGRDSLLVWMSYSASSEAPPVGAFRNEAMGQARYLFPLMQQCALQQRLSGYYFEDTRAVGLAANVRWRLLTGLLYGSSRGQLTGEIGWELLRHSVRRDEGPSAALGGY